jgi:predicted phosphodiesterase
MARWTDEEIVLLGQLMQAGHSYRSAAVVLSRTYGQVRAKCRRHDIESKAENIGATPKVVEAPPEIPAYDGALCLPGDLGGGLMIVADVHSPCTDWVAASRVALIAQKYLEEPRRLVIAGDMMNWDVYSRYENVIPLPTLRQEIDAAKFAIQLWLETFDHVYLILGNHDYRWLKNLKGAFDEELFTDLLKSLLWNDERLTVNVYSYLDVICEQTGIWHITHTPEYSKVPLSKARFLSNVTKDRHLMLAHQHQAGIALDESGRFVLVDIPALADPEKLAYVMLHSTTKPRMKTGFVMLRGGWPYLFADGLTDWGYWLE